MSRFAEIQDKLKRWRSEGIPTPHTVCIPWMNWLLTRLIEERAKWLHCESAHDPLQHRNDPNYGKGWEAYIPEAEQELREES